MRITEERKRGILKCNPSELVGLFTSLEEMVLNLTKNEKILDFSNYRKSPHLFQKPSPRKKDLSIHAKEGQFYSNFNTFASFYNKMSLTEQDLNPSYNIKDINPDKEINSVSSTVEFVIITLCREFGIDP